jgi:hypothetical protein
MFSFNRIRTLSLAALTLGIAPLAGCAADSTQDEGIDDFDDEVVQEATSAIVTQNLALGRPTSQSTTAVGGVSSRAVDGNTNGHWDNGSVTHTDAHGWWQVDLESVQPVGNVVLWNRTDCCAERLNNFELVVSSDGINWQSYPYPAVAGQRVGFTVNRAARYVRVQLNGNEPLSLAEVQVFAAPGQLPGGHLADFFRTGGSSDPALSYGRGVGTIPTITSTCGAGQDWDAGLCYPTCAPGYTGVGPVCWQICPPGYADTGAFCQRDLQIISANNSGCPWYDVCGLTFAPGCSVCPPGYINDGCTCRIPPETLVKSSYGRGAGSIPTIVSTCGGGQDLDAGLCYPSCEAGYHGVGPVCWLDTITFESITAGACNALRDPLLAQLAQLTGKTHTFGFGVGIAAGASLSAEAGVAYGANGEFGCYFSTCAGATPDVSISAWGAFGVMNSFADVAGDSIVTYAGLSAEIPEIPVSIGGAIGLVTTPSFEPQGFVGNLSVGLSLSPVPVQIGTAACHALVQQTQ